METTSVQAGQVYRHFKKGTLYEVICIATHTEREEELVVYRDQETGRYFARPLEMFTSHKETPGGRVKRFTLLTVSDKEVGRE